MTSARLPVGGIQREAPEQLTRLVSITVACMTAAAIVFPRSATAMFLVPVVAVLALLIAQPAWRHQRLPVNGMAVAAVLFALWGLMSAAWSPAPMASLTKPLFVLGGVAGIGALVMVMRRASPGIAAAIGWGMIAGFLAGAALVCVETLSGQAITRFFMNTFSVLREGYDKHLNMRDGVVVAVSEGNINRRATVVTLLLLPVVLMIVGVASAGLRRALLLVVLAIGAIMMVASTHQSSQAAILVGAMTLAMAWAAPLISRWIVGLAWCVACLLVVPIVTQLHGADLHKNASMFHSARHRVVIWNTTAVLTKQSPLIGIGADATPAATDQRARQQLADGTARTEGGYKVDTARHAHNMFLQVWYELGAVGALLLTAVGIGALALAAKARQEYQPFLVAQFAAIAVLASFSFSIWQLWFQATIGLSIMGCLMAMSIAETRHGKA